jgi:hypothetical protein
MILEELGEDDFHNPELATRGISVRAVCRSANGEATQHASTPTGLTLSPRSLLCGSPQREPSLRLAADMDRCVRVLPGRICSELKPYVNI